MRTGGQGHPTPILTPSPPSSPQVPHSHAQKAYKMLVSTLLDSCSRTDGPTDGRTDKASYRVACPQLKRPGYNVILDGWAGVFNPVPHPLQHMHATAVTQLMAIARFHNFQLHHHRWTYRLKESCEYVAINEEACAFSCTFACT